MTGIALLFDLCIILMTLCLVITMWTGDMRGFALLGWVTCVVIFAMGLVAA